MAWCRSYGCREHVEQYGDYCVECEEIIETTDSGGTLYQ